MSLKLKTKVRSRPRIRGDVRPTAKSGGLAWLRYCYELAWRSGAERWRWRP